MRLLNRLDPARPRSVVGWALVVGVVAGLVAATFHAVVTEPLIDDAIAIEESRAADPDGAEADEAEGAGSTEGADGAVGTRSVDGIDPIEHPAAEPEQVSRSDQRGAGLFLGYALLGAAYALVLAVVALALRGSWLDPWRRVVLAGSMLAASLTLVPWLKYPPNPPAVGDPATAGDRQRNFWILVALVGVLLAGAAHLSARLRQRQWPGPRRLAVIAGASALVGGVIVALMPAVTDPLPADVPTNLIWRFRVASLTGNALLWGTLVVAFGLWWSEARTEAAAARKSPAPEPSTQTASQNSIPFSAEIPES